MKRFISIILVLATMLSLCSPLASCSTGATASLQMGTWLDLIAEAFGMSEYTSDEPYFEKVSPGDTYFGAFQLAAEWEILEPSNSVSSTTEVKWKDALLTLVNAGNFVGADAAEDEKIAYAIANFDPTIRDYWMDRNIKMSEAVPLLDKAADLWVNREFTERIEERTFSDDVLNLIDEENVEYEVDGDTVRIAADLVEGLEPGDVYTLPGIENEVGSSINTVENIEYDGDTAVITNSTGAEEEDSEAGEDGEVGEDDAQDATDTDTVIASDVADVFAHIEEIREQTTEMIDFSQIGAIYDANGNALYTNDNGVNYDLAEVSYDRGEDNVYVTNLLNVGNKPQATELGLFDSGSLTFKVDGVKVNLKISGNGINLTLSEDTWKKSNASREVKQTVSVSGGISGLKLTKDIDYSWGKLRSAMVKLDYTTTISGGVKGSDEVDVGTYMSGEGHKSIRSLSTIVSQYKDALGRMGKDARNTNCQKELYICRINIPCLSNGIWGVDFIVKGKISASGQLTVTVTMKGAKGVEYRNGNLRVINDMDRSLDVVAEAEASITIAAGLELAILTYKAVEVTVDAGVGGKIKYTSHVVDAEFHLISSSPMSVPMAMAGNLETLEMLTSPEDILMLAESEGGTWKNYIPGTPVVLTTKTCVDWEIYPIIRLYAGIPFLKSNPNISLGIPDGIKGTYNGSSVSSGKASKYSLTGHIHFPNNLASALTAGSVGKGILEAIGYGKTCDYEFTPWDQDPSETTAATEATDSTYNDGLDTTEVIAVADQRLFLDEGGSGYITITGLPMGYTLDDVVAKSENTAIATVDKNGKVTAGELAGTVAIYITTSDGKFTTVVAVTVNPKGPDSFVGLGDLV